jgi:hypothetical protein
MNREELDEILKAFETRAVKGEVLPSAEASFSMYAAHSGASLSVTRIEALKIAGTVLFARTSKKETFAVPLASVFALSMDVSPGSTARKPAGFV